MTDEAASVSTIDLGTGPLMRPVLARVVSAFAARADLPVDRVFDARLLGEALAAHAPRHLANGRLSMTIHSAPRHLTLRLGPLESGAGARLLADTVIPEVGPILERLADTVRVADDAGSDYVVMELSAPR